MKMGKDELQKVIHSARRAKRIADVLQLTMNRKGTETIADEIWGDLTDLLLEFTGEAKEEQDLHFTDTFRLLFLDYKTDESVADEMIRMNREHAVDEEPMTDREIVTELNETVSAQNNQISRLREKLGKKILDCDRLRHWLQEAGNELCYKCGDYRNAHNGACDGCRWKEVKRGGEPE